MNKKIKNRIKKNNALISNEIKLNDNKKEKKIILLD